MEGWWEGGKKGIVSGGKEGLSREMEGGNDYLVEGVKEGICFER